MLTGGIAKTKVKSFQSRHTWFCLCQSYCFPVRAEAQPLNSTGGIRLESEQNSQESAQASRSDMAEWKKPRRHHFLNQFLPLEPWFPAVKWGSDSLPPTGPHYHVTAVLSTPAHYPSFTPGSFPPQDLCAYYSLSLEHTCS